LRRHRDVIITEPVDPELEQTESSTGACYRYLVDSLLGGWAICISRLPLYGWALPSGCQLREAPTSKAEQPTSRRRSSSSSSGGGGKQSQATSQDDMAASLRTQPIQWHH